LSGAIKEAESDFVSDDPKKTLSMERRRARHGSASDLIMEGAFGQTEFPGEPAEGEPVLLGQAEVPVAGDFNASAHGSGNVLTGGMVDVVSSGHGDFFSGVLVNQRSKIAQGGLHFAF
jgi:hypothetical protein